MFTSPRANWDRGNGNGVALELMRQASPPAIHEPANSFVSWQSTRRDLLRGWSRNPDGFGDFDNPVRVVDSPTNVLFFRLESRTGLCRGKESNRV
jgi:hypothetical protein